MMNWSVTGIMDARQSAHASTPFPVCNFSGNHARIPRDAFLDTTGSRCFVDLLRVRVAVMDVGRMFVLVRGQIVPVTMRVFAHDCGFMHVVVVPVVVAMRV